LNALAEKYPDEIERILSRYPPENKRAAVMPLLYLAQRQHGFITKAALGDIAALLDITPTDVASVVGFYSLYHAEPGGAYRIQVCNDLPCALRGADEFLSSLCENLGIQVGETTPDGLVTVEAVMCLAGCDKAPMFQVQTSQGLEYHELQSVESTLELIETWRQERAAAGDRCMPTGPSDGSLKTQAESGTTALSQDERLRIKGQAGRS
jgi:NADH-quinone oxidoreductase subunit E